MNEAFVASKCKTNSADDLVEIFGLLNAVGPQYSDSAGPKSCDNELTTSLGNGNGDWNQFWNVQSKPIEVRLYLIDLSIILLVADLSIILRL